MWIKADEQAMKVIALLITDVLTTCMHIYNRKQESFDLHEHWLNLTLYFKVVKSQNQMDKHPCCVCHRVPSLFCVVMPGCDMGNFQLFSERRCFRKPSGDLWGLPLLVLLVVFRAKHLVTLRSHKLNNTKCMQKYNGNSSRVFKMVIHQNELHR